MEAQQIQKDYPFQIIETYYNKQIMRGLFIQKKIVICQKLKRKRFRLSVQLF